MAFPATQQVGLYRIIIFSSIYRLLMFCPVCREPWKDEVCYECGAFYEKQEFVVTDLSNYKVRHKRIYKRLDHFKEVLCQFQGKEGKHIPQEVIEGIRDNIAKDKGSITLLDIKQSLRKLKLNKYVENIFYIQHVLVGTTLPYIRREAEDKMVRLFKQVERVYGVTRHLANFARTSFLNYYYVVYKLLESLQPELLPRVPLLKTSLRLKQHDTLWRDICEELDWTFRPTKVMKGVQG